MSKKKLNIEVGLIVAGIASVATVTAIADQKEQKRAKAIAERNGVKIRKPLSIYEQYVKRPLDAVLSIGANVALSPILVITALAVKKKLGSPVLFTQERPGRIDASTGKEEIFKLYKFRTMTDERDEDGKLLPDEIRLTKFGAWLRSTSLDELPELFNIIKGDMAVIGPRPQLVRDMVFMTDEQRQRHSVRPGLSGLAQVRGRNAISWEGKLSTDLEYIKNITFAGDAKIVGETIGKVFAKEGITEEGQATALDFGDELLKEGKVDQETYDKKQAEANEILKDASHIISLDEVIQTAPAPSTPYSVLLSLYIKEQPEYLDLAIKSMVEQTYKPNEIVIVKDGAITPELEAVLDKYKAEYPTLFNIIGYEENRGLGLALNFGLEHCRNELVARMDTDDIAKPDRCERQVKAFELHTEIDILGGQIEEFIGDTSKTVGKREVPLTDNELKAYMQKRCPFNHMTVMYKKSAVLKAGNYKHCPSNEDYYLWIRMALCGCKFANLPKVLVDVRVGKEMYSRRGGLKYFQSEQQIQRLMLDKKIINVPRYMVNVGERLVLQVLMPNKVRGWVFQKFARKK